ncbi:MAG: tetratricopeptide repeat protein [Rhodospirillaceae bacterium]|nr:tetratricopeptide repeat protein [Rhodospirillaceae bacterium]
MADHIPEDALMREINEELREEQMHKLWKRYGSFIIGVAVSVVVIVAGYQGWRTYTTSVRMSESEILYNAEMAAKNGDTNAALSQLGNLGEDGKSGYKVLAQFQQAALLAKGSDSNAAAIIYQEITEDTSNDSGTRGLALVLGALQELKIAGNNRDELKKRLNTANSDNNPWRHSVREILALLEIESGNKENAKKIFAILGNDSQAPDGIRSRAQKILSVLGS